MSTILRLHPRPLAIPQPANPLPALLQTPSGLALLELQGNFNLPEPPHANDNDDAQAPGPRIPVGRLDFPDYHPNSPDSTAWMSRVYMFVGQHQRLAGEVKKLPRAIAVIRRRAGTKGAGGSNSETEAAEDLEVVEVVKYKLVFSHRPEPVGSA